MSAAPPKDGPEDEPDIDKDPNFPPLPEFGPTTKLSQRQAMFGAFEFVHEPVPGNYENIRILGSWEKDHIVDVPIPQLKLALGPGAPATIRFHRKAAAQLQGLWADWEQAGLLDRIVSFDGAYVPRFIRGSTTTLSNHAFGSAFDINWRFNQLGQTPAKLGETGCVRELVLLAHKHGFFWGGHYRSRLDGMHFEIAKLSNGVA